MKNGRKGPIYRKYHAIYLIWGDTSKIRNVVHVFMYSSMVTNHDCPFCVWFNYIKLSYNTWLFYHHSNNLKWKCPVQSQTKGLYFKDITKQEWKIKVKKIQNNLWSL